MKKLKEVFLSISLFAFFIISNTFIIHGNESIQSTPVPNLIGKTEEQALQIIRIHGFEVKTEVCIN